MRYHYCGCNEDTAHTRCLLRLGAATCSCHLNKTGPIATTSGRRWSISVSTPTPSISAERERKVLTPHRSEYGFPWNKAPSSRFCKRWRHRVPTNQADSGRNTTSVFQVSAYLIAAVIAIASGPTPKQRSDIRARAQRICLVTSFDSFTYPARPFGGIPQEYEPTASKKNNLPSEKKCKLFENSPAIPV